MPPLLINPQGIIKDNDAVIFFNFREDRMRQIIQPFIDSNFNKFSIQPLKNIFVAGMTQYIEGNSNLHIAFPSPVILNGLAETLSKNGKKQLRIAETEKYAHVTFFFNCLKNGAFEGEKDILIKSDRAPLDDPKMKAVEITEEFLKALKSDEFDFILINFANPDMLAHYGQMDKVIPGLETVDKMMGFIRQAVLIKNGFLMIASDHGNAEALTYKGTGEAETKHNPNPVPIYFVASNLEQARTEEEIKASRKEAKALLSDIAPTVLELMDIEKPLEMTGESLLKLLNYSAA